MEQVKVLNEYYTNLNYDDKKQHDLLKKLNNIFYRIHDYRFKYDDDLITRLQILIEIIHQNMPFFSSIFKHIDVITSILHYLTEYSQIIANKLEVTLDYVSGELPSLLVITLITMCTGSVMSSFFLDCLLDVSQNILDMYDDIHSIVTCGTKKHLFILDVFQQRQLI